MRLKKRNRIIMLVASSTIAVVVVVGTPPADAQLGNLGSIINTVGSILGINTNSPFFQILNSLSSILGGNFSGGVGGIISAVGQQAGWSPAQIAQINQQAQQTIQLLSTVYSTITNGTFSGTLAGVQSIMGQLGIINPNATVGQAVTGGIAPNPQASPPPSTANADSAEEVYEITKFGKSMPRQLSNTIAEYVLGEEGQQVLADQVQKTSEGITTSDSAMKSTEKDVEKAIELVDLANGGADLSVDMAKDASKAKNSQDVLKAISAQTAINSKMAVINAGNQTLINKGLLSLNSQMTAVQSELAAHTQKLTTMQIMAASSLQTQAETLSEVNRTFEYQHRKDLSVAGGASQSMNDIYIPGFAVSSSTNSTQNP
jgi:hypothetical protein